MPDDSFGDSDSELSPHLLRKLKIEIAGYALGSIIGEGGQAIVLNATQLSTGRTVAIKLLREGRLATPAARERFKREVSVLAGFQHPHIVGILDFGETADGYDYLVMNYVDGRSLRRFLEDYRAKPAQDPKFPLRLFAKICHAVAYAHQRDIIHRDLCPANILVDDRGEPSVLDFGLARNESERFSRHRRTKVTETGQFLGKLAYASPEQATCDLHRIGKPSDVYALGMILYEILTDGEHPYPVVGNVRDVLDNIVECMPIPPSVKVAGQSRARRSFWRRAGFDSPATIDTAIEQVALKTLAKEPGERYASAAELAQEVENYLAGLPPVAENATKQIAGRMRMRWDWSVAVVVAALVLTGIVWRMMQSPNLDGVASPNAEVSTRLGLHSPSESHPVADQADFATSSGANPFARLYPKPEILGGPWRVAGDELIAEPLVPVSIIGFGDPNWSEYDFSFEAKKEKTWTCVGAMFHWRDGSNRYKFHVGASSNQWCEVVRRYKGRIMYRERVAKRGGAEVDRWFSIRVEVRGANVNCFHDDELVLQLPNARFAAGKVGIEIGAGPVRIRNVRVVSPAGKLLWEGPPFSNSQNVNETDHFQPGSVWASKGPSGGSWQVAVDAREGDRFVGRLIRPDALIEPCQGWVSQGLFRADSGVLIGRFHGDEMTTQPHGARGQLTFRRQL